MAKMNYLAVWMFYSSLQCHMILQKSFYYADLVLKNFFIIISVEINFSGNYTFFSSLANAIFILS